MIRLVAGEFSGEQTIRTEIKRQGVRLNYYFNQKTIKIRRGLNTNNILVVQYLRENFNEEIISHPSEQKCKKIRNARDL